MVMTYIIFFTVSLLASIVGTICGVGGGVFMKPILDALGVLPVNIITFLSSCTVFSMACYNVVSSFSFKGEKQNENLIDWNLTSWLAIGSALGGLLGTSLYSSLRDSSSNAEAVGGYQAIALLVAVAITLIYTTNRHKVKSLQLKNPIILMMLGLLLGTISSFVGIGGGPINLAVLYFFFSMSTKAAAANSLYIILISQSTSLISNILTRNIPEEILSFDVQLWMMMIGMIICGVSGGIIGKTVNKKLSAQKVDKLFNILCVIIIFLCIYNAMTKFNIL